MTRLSGSSARGGRLLPPLHRSIAAQAQPRRCRAPPAAVLAPRLPRSARPRRRDACMCSRAASCLRVLYVLSRDQATTPLIGHCHHLGCSLPPCMRLRASWPLHRHRTCLCACKPLVAFVLLLHEVLSHCCFCLHNNACLACLPASCCSAS